MLILELENNDVNVSIPLGSLKIIKKLTDYK